MDGIAFGNIMKRPIITVWHYGIIHIIKVIKRWNGEEPRRQNTSTTIRWYVLTNSTWGYYCKFKCLFFSAKVEREEHNLSKHPNVDYVARFQLENNLVDRSKFSELYWDPPLDLWQLCGMLGLRSEDMRFRILFRFLVGRFTETGCFCGPESAEDSVRSKLLICFRFRRWKCQKEK